MTRDPRWAVGRVYREEVKEKMAVAKKKAAPASKKSMPMSKKDMGKKCPKK